MYYKVNRDSETGKKLTEIDHSLATFRANALQFAKKYGFNNFAYSGYGNHRFIYGFCDPFSETDLKSFSKELTNEGTIYVPNKKFKIGKELIYLIKSDDSLKNVSHNAVNKAIGITGGAKPRRDTRGLRIIYHGYNNSNTEYYGIEIDQDVIDLSGLSSDLEEITSKEYYLLFEQN